MSGSDAETAGKFKCQPHARSLPGLSECERAPGYRIRCGQGRRYSTIGPFRRSRSLPCKLRFALTEMAMESFLLVPVGFGAIDGSAGPEVASARMHLRRLLKFTQYTSPVIPEPSRVHRLHNRPVVVLSLLSLQASPPNSDFTPEWSPMALARDTMLQTGRNVGRFSRENFVFSMP